MASSATDAIRLVKGAIDDLATALARGDAAGLLTAEAALAARTDALTRIDRTALPAERDQVRRLILETKLALVRCQRLGATVRDLAAVYAGSDAYGRDGRAAAAGIRPAGN